MRPGREIERCPLTPIEGAYEGPPGPPTMNGPVVE